MCVHRNVEPDLITPSTDERDSLRHVLHLIDDLPDHLIQIGAYGGEALVLPTSAARALRRVIDVLSRDRAVSISEVGQRLSIDQVSSLLNLPIAHVVRVIDSGELSASQDDGLASVALDDLLSFIHVRHAQRRDALDELTRLSEELGLYDVEE